MSASEVLQHNLLDIRRRQHEALVERGIAKLVGLCLELKDVPATGMYIVWKRPAATVSNAEIATYPIMAENFDIFFGAIDDVTTCVLGVEYLPPKVRPELQPVNYRYVATRMQLGNGLEIAPATSDISHDDAYFVNSLVRELEDSIGNLPLDRNLVAREPFVTEGDIYVR